MTLSFRDLTTPITNDEHEANALAVLAVLGFPVTNWAADSVPRRLVRSFCELYADIRGYVRSVATGGYLDLATGDWLTLLAKSQYQRDRLGAVFAEVSSFLSAAPASGPHTITPGQLVIASEATGHRFTNITGGTLLPGGALQVTWRAESAGSAFNAADGTAMRVVAGTIAGVTAGAATLTASGANEETDVQLRIRCKVRWAELAALTGPADYYVSLALNTPTAPGVRRVFVRDDNPRGAGTVDVYIAGETGPSTPEEVAAVDAYIQPRRAISSEIAVLAAKELPVEIIATAYARAPAPTAATLEAAARAYVNSLPIGGDAIPALAPGRLFTDQIEHAMMNASANVVTVNLVQPAANLAMAANEVAVPSVTISVQEV
jgi:hypothetical protein